MRDRSAIAPSKSSPLESLDHSHPDMAIAEEVAPAGAEKHSRSRAAHHRCDVALLAFWKMVLATPADIP